MLTFETFTCLERISPNILFLLQIVLVRMLYHSNRKVANKEAASSRWNIAGPDITTWFVGGLWKTLDFILEK